MSICISPSNQILGIDDPSSSVDIFNNAVQVALESYQAKKTQEGLTSTEKDIFKDLENDAHPKYLAGIVNDRLILLSIHPESLSESGNLKTKVYELTLDDSSPNPTGTQINISKISSNTLQGLGMQRKLSKDPEFKEQIRNAEEVSTMLLESHSRPASPTSPQELIAQEHKTSRR